MSLNFSGPLSEIRWSLPPWMRPVASWIVTARSRLGLYSIRNVVNWTPDDPIADAVRALEGANLDRDVAKKIEEFTKILKRVRSFRDRLFPILGRHVITRAGRGVPAAVWPSCRP